MLTPEVIKAFFGFLLISADALIAGMVLARAAISLVVFWRAR